MWEGEEEGGLLIVAPKVTHVTHKAQGSFLAARDLFTAAVLHAAFVPRVLHP